MFVEGGGSVPLTFSKDGLIAWLERQPPDKEYEYCDVGGCLAAQFNAAVGRNYEVPNPFNVVAHLFKFEHRLERVACQKPYTMGAALKRAKRLLF